MAPHEPLQKAVALSRNAWEYLRYQLMRLFGQVRARSERTRERARVLFYSTSDQVLERAEETRKGVRIRMAILELEHHLNRLYPQIGKLICDEIDDGRTPLPEDEQLRTRVELAREYRTRLGELRADLEAHLRREDGEQRSA
jgi:hypothetical protein